MTGNIPTTFTRLQTGTKWNQPQSNMGDAVLSQLATITYADAASTKTLFYLPGYAQVLTIHLDVTTAFNASTTNLLYVGVSGTTTYFVSGANGSSTGRVTIGTSGNYNNWSSVGSSDVIVTATFSGVGSTTATAGSALVTVLYSMKS